MDFFLYHIEVFINMKKNKISEDVDIKGIDELVYNPATKKGGAIGYGYDNGQRKEGITWSGHDNHLHIGFTKRPAAIAIIDKAHSMGLKTTENPYAKKDPNNKIDTHAKGSLHYKNFPGIPTVGMAVDISGDQDKITKLIKWIETNYSTGVSQQSDTETETDPETDTPSEEGGFLSNWAANIGNALMPNNKSLDVRSLAGLKEDIERIKELL